METQLFTLWLPPNANSKHFAKMQIVIGDVLTRGFRPHPIGRSQYCPGRITINLGVAYLHRAGVPARGHGPADGDNAMWRYPLWREPVSDVQRDFGFWRQASYKKFWNWYNRRATYVKDVEWFVVLKRKKKYFQKLLKTAEVASDLSTDTKTVFLIIVFVKRIKDNRIIK